MHLLTFFGSDQYAEVVLQILLSSPLKSTIYNLSSIITDRPKPKGKDQIIEPNPIEKLAIKHNINVLYYPDNQTELNNFISNISSTINHRVRPKLERAKEDQPSTIGLCASFDHLLPPKIISLFKGNLFNLHPSLLPQYRNVSPVQYTIALGDQETGITLFKISEGIDNGEILGQLTESILPTDTTPTLTNRLFALGAQLFLDYLDNSSQAPAHHSEARESEGLVFTKRLTRDSGFVEWPTLHRLLQNLPVSPSDTVNELLRLRLSRTPIIHDSSPIIHDLLRALTPWPGVWSLIPQPKADPPRADTKKADLRISLSPCDHHEPCAMSHLLIPGKPNPITFSDFTKYYLLPSPPLPTHPNHLISILIHARW